MKAIQLTENGKLKLSEVDLINPSKDECQIKVLATGVCSSDIPRAFSNGAYFYPLIMGHEFSGQITKLGEDVNDFSLGDRVAIFPLIPCGDCDECKIKKFQRCHNYSYYGSRTNGAFAQYVNVRSWNLIKIPNLISNENAALIEPISVVLNAIRKFSKVKKSSKILIMGAGFLGLLAIQILKKKYESDIFVYDRNKFKLDIAKKIGALPIKNLEDSDEFDYIIEGTGSSDIFKKSILVSKPSAQIVIMGNPSSSYEIPQDFVSKVLRKELEIKGTWNSNYKNMRDDWLEAVNLLTNGLNPSALVSHRVTLDSAVSQLIDLNKHRKKQISIEHIKSMIIYD